MLLWCNREHEVIEIIVDKLKECSAVLEEMNKINGIIKKSSDHNKVYFFIKKCLCASEDSVSQNIEVFNLLHISPVVINHGWEYYRVIAFKHRDIKRLLQRFEDKSFTFEILRKVPLNGFITSSLTLTADSLFSELTEKQIEALLTAYGYGYFRSPRKANVKTIAKQNRIPRTTFQEHLMKAENKLVASLVPYVQLFKLTTQERRESLKMK